MLVALSTTLFSQPSLSAQGIAGKYEDHFNNEIYLNVNGTYSAKHYFDINQYWDIGYWQLAHDTIYFSQHLIYDTLYSDNGDSLVLSQDTLVNRISYDSTRIGFSGYQEKALNPGRLVVKHGRLYHLKDNGKLMKRATGGRKYISIRKDRIGERPIHVLSWNSKVPAYFIKTE
jgi:hypothetical protein